MAINRKEPTDLTLSKWLETDQYFEASNVVNTTDEGEHLELEDTAGVYKTSGYRVSNPLALSGTAKNSNIKWTSTEPTDTDIKIYTAVSGSNTTEPSFETTTDISPSDDAWVSSSGNGTGYDLRVGGWSDVYISGIKFDLSSAPSNASSAKIKLYYTGAGSGSAISAIKWQRITEDWDEGTITYSNRPSGMNNNQGTSVSLPSANNWVEIDITDLYNSWKDGTYSNYGISIAGNLSSYSNRWAFFASKEYTTDTSKRPYLQVVSNDHTEATSNSTIPGISTDQDLTGKYLWVRQELSTTNTSATPRLSTLEVLVETAKKSLAFFKFF